MILSKIMFNKLVTNCHEEIFLSETNLFYLLNAPLTYYFLISAGLHSLLTININFLHDLYHGLHFFPPLFLYKQNSE